MRLKTLGVIFVALFMSASIMSSSAVAQPNPGISLPDDKTGHQIQVVYVETDSAEGSNYHKNGQIIEWVNQLQAWLMKQTGKEFVFDTYKGNLDISYLKFDGNLTEKGDEDEQLVQKYRELNPDTYFGKTLAFVIDQTKLPRESGGLCGWAGNFSDYALIFPNLVRENGKNCGKNIPKHSEVNNGFSFTASTILHEIIHSYGVEHVCFDSTDIMIGNPECPKVNIKEDTDLPATFDATGKYYYGGDLSGVDLNTLKIWSDGSGQFTPFLNQGNCAPTDACRFLYSIVDMSWSGNWQLEIILLVFFVWVWMVKTILTVKDEPTDSLLKELPNNLLMSAIVTGGLLGLLWILLRVERLIFN